MGNVASVLCLDLPDDDREADHATLIITKHDNLRAVTVHWQNQATRTALYTLVREQLGLAVNFNSATKWSPGPTEINRNFYPKTAFVSQVVAQLMQGSNLLPGLRARHPDRGDSPEVHYVWHRPLTEAGARREPPPAHATGVHHAAP